MKKQLLASKAEAAKTPSGPPPIPINMSTPNLSFVTYNAPATSPSEISFLLTLNLSKVSRIDLCLGLSSKHTVNSDNFLDLASAKFLNSFQS